jgi:archaellum component FlaD/FlaE
MGHTNSRLEANRKRREDLENQEPMPGEEERRHHVPEIEVNDEDIKRAMEYMTGAGKRQGKRMPQPYNRLWENVAQKSRKAKELQRVLSEQRQLEWLKLLLSNNLLHPTSKKSFEVLK